MEDLNKIYFEVKRLKKVNLNKPEAWEDESLARYLRDTNYVTLDDIRTAKNKIENHKLEEATPVKQVAGAIWYAGVDQFRSLTPKRLLFILTHLDKLLPFMPESFVKKIVKALDAIADKVYETIEK